MSVKRNPTPAAYPLKETAFTIWQRANAARKLRGVIDNKVLDEKDPMVAKRMEKQMDFLLDYCMTLDVTLSFVRAVDLPDAVAHLSVAHGDLEGLMCNEPTPDDKATIERVFRLVSSALGAVAQAAGLDLAAVTGENHLPESIADQFVEVAS